MKDVAGKGRAGERGAVSIKGVLAVLVLAAGVLAVIKIAPVYFEQRAVIYKVDELANKAAVRNAKPEVIQKEIESIRKEYDLPEGSISFTSGQNSAHIALSYNRKIDFFVTTWDWKVEHKVNGKSF